MKRESDSKNKISHSYNQSRADSFGKYGLLNLSDVFTRKLEFQAWLTEIKKLTKNELGPENEKKYLEEFIDQFNNAEFPSKKYYDIIKYQATAITKMLRKRKREMDKLISKKGSAFMMKDEEFIFDDEGQKEKEKKLMKELEQKRKLEDAISTMDRSKAEAMKDLDYKGNLMRHLYQTGDVAGAKDIYNLHFNPKQEKDKPHNVPPIENLDDDNN